MRKCGGHCGELTLVGMRINVALVAGGCTRVGDGDKHNFQQAHLEKKTFRNVTTA